jgi:hypothetical protein
MMYHKIGADKTLTPREKSRQQKEQFEKFMATKGVRRDQILDHSLAQKTNTLPQP